MKNISVNFLIKDSPTPVAVLDTKMQFISHSDFWIKEFNLSKIPIIGKSYYDVITDTPLELIAIFKDCLTGTSSANKGQKFIYPKGSIRWIKWKVNCWKDEDNIVGGVIIIIEDITQEKRREELLKVAEKVARIGGWELDLKTNEVF